MRLLVDGRGEGGKGGGGGGGDLGVIELNLSVEGKKT